MKHDVLVSISVPASRGLTVLKQVTGKLIEGSELFKISSIYQVSRKADHSESLRKLRNHDWVQCLEVVLWIKSPQTPLQWIEKIKSTEGKYSMKSLNQNVSCHLNFFDDETTMTPQVTLPHPDLHLRTVTLELIAEIWPDKVHPILKKSVYELSQSAKHKEVGEFFSTGAQLVQMN